MIDKDTQVSLCPLHAYAYTLHTQLETQSRLLWIFIILFIFSYIFNTHQKCINSSVSLQPGDHLQVIFRSKQLKVYLRYRVSVEWGKTPAHLWTRVWIYLLKLSLPKKILEKLELSEEQGIMLLSKKKCHLHPIPKERYNYILIFIIAGHRVPSKILI